MGLERRRPDEEVDLGLAVPVRCRARRRAFASRPARPSSTTSSPGLLGELAARSLLVRLPRLEAAADRRPDRRARPGSRSGRAGRARRRPRRSRAPLGEGEARSRRELPQRPEPAQSLVPRHRRVRGRRRRQDEERASAEPPLLETELRPLRRTCPWYATLPTNAMTAAGASARSPRAARRRRRSRPCAGRPSRASSGARRS